MGRRLLKPQGKRTRSNWLPTIGFIVFAVACAAKSMASAATIEVLHDRSTGQDLTFITVIGELQPGDESRFADAALGVPAGGVVLEGPGGDLQAGIEIGKAIRLKGFATLVADDSMCASACALAWLGGRDRFMAANAMVGFHAAALAADPSHSADSVGNALVGAYLNELGLPPSAIIYITQPQPNDIQWLTIDDAERYGIAVRLLTAPPEDAPAANSQGSGPPAQPDWSSYGEWIQTYSRSNPAEAKDLARDYSRSFPNTFVFRYDNGWYVVVMGPYPRGDARPEKDRLVRLGQIPRDSLVTPGYRFVELVWGGMPQRPSLAVTEPDLEDVALHAADTFYGTWSGSNSQALDYLDQSYAPRVTYFGRPVPKSDVMKEKRDFVRRWTERTYLVRRGASAQCNTGRVCVVHGVVDWHAYSPSENTTSVGIASFELTFDLTGPGYSILGEESKVLSRRRHPGR